MNSACGFGRRPVPTGTDCSLSCGFVGSTQMVPSLRGRIVPLYHVRLRDVFRPVPTGTDCSYIQCEAVCLKQSRPYGDGLFSGTLYPDGLFYVPSLRGRIVLFASYSWYVILCPVPTGTDCSFVQCSSVSLGGVPSLRGRIVPHYASHSSGMRCPVPTGTDCSVFFSICSRSWMSRPYGDGLFLYRYG